MKKLTGIILAMVLILSTGTTGVFAASSKGHNNGAAHKVGASACVLVDENNDGICDTHKENCKFVDANKDGVCDTCIDGGACPQDGTGRTGRNGHEKGHEKGHGNGHEKGCNRD